MARTRGVLTTLLPALVLLLLVGGACGGSDTTSPAEQAAAPATPIGSGQPATATPRPRPANPEIIVSTTTSTVDSGLLDVLQPLFEAQTGYKLTILSQGSGAALKTGERGEADVVLAHSPAAEREFMNGGHGTRRELVMHNDFILVGPARDPAGVRAAKSVNEAMTKLASGTAPFVSRGDNSGTHALELTLWKAVNVTPTGARWYIESGTGMGQTLQIAGDQGGYTISDRATFLAQGKQLGLEIMREGDGALLNIYHVIQVDPKKSTRVNAEGAAAFIEFLLAPDTQRRIGEFGTDKYGQPLFVPDAGKDATKLGS